ncbi:MULTISPECIES: hypothetical protein [unclassified Novosphingobium]|uniref:hypothetical protein n=1 Tax=unclassified Novosphingobium TaxID=2644732 RepID=UPI001F21FF1D|nr:MULTISPECIES: hypothetical protein [unclassified Novosphingobium]
MDKNVVDDLRREVGHIASGGGAWQDITKPMDHLAFTPAPTDVRLRETGRTKEPAEAIPFGRWVLQQIGRCGFIGELAKAAKAGRAFPKDGASEAVRKRISEQGADPDMHEALDDAELDWSAL